MWWHKCDCCPFGSNCEEQGAQPAVGGHAGPVEVWRAETVERRGAAMMDVWSGDIHPFVGYSQDYDRHCLQGSLLGDKWLPLMGVGGIGVGR